MKTKHQDSDQAPNLALRTPNSAPRTSHFAPQTPHLAPHTKDLLLTVAFACLAGFLLFYRLGWGSVEPWDEAWYAEIARNVLDGHWFFLRSHFSLFVDHPPLGYWYLALGRLVIGTSSFASRAPMALAGVATVVTAYFTGKKLHNRTTGIIAALVLISTRWFLLRSRTGNLDTLLVLSQLLVFYLSYTAETNKAIFKTWLALSASLLIKTFVSFTLLPLVIWTTLRNSQNKVKSLLYLLIPLIVVGAWYGIMYKHSPALLLERLGIVVLRSQHGWDFQLLNPASLMLLLQSLIHRWHKPLLLSLALSPFFLRLRSVRWVIAYFSLVAWPYFVSSKTLIWHLMPLIPPIALIIGLISTKMIEAVPKRILPLKTKHRLGLLLAATICYTLLTLKELGPEITPSTNVPSDQQVLGEAVSHLPGFVYLDVFGDVATSVLYYANRPIVYVHTKDQSIDFSSIPRPYSIMTYSSTILDSGCDYVATSNEYAAIHCQ